MADQNTSQRQKSFMNVRTALITNTQTTVLMKPGQTPFHDPAKYTQSTAVLASTLGQDRIYTHFPHSLTMRFRVVGAIALHTIWPVAGATHLSSYSRNGINQRQQLCDIMVIGTGQSNRQGNAVGIGDHMMLGAGFPAIRGIWAGFRPPKTARTEALSTKARDQSILSASRSLFNRIRWILSQTPAFCQSRRRRQQVIPEPQPISWGRYSQPMPVLRTNKTPVKALRFSNGFRPGYRNRRRLAGGRSGSISFHNWSSKIGLAMGNLLVNAWLPMSSAMYVLFLYSFC